MRFLKIVLSMFLFVILLALSSSAAGQERSPGPIRTDSTRAITFKSKSPMGALLRSVIFPGWGQLYNKKYLKAGLAFGAEVTFLTFMAIEWQRMNEHKEIFDSLPLDHPDKSFEYEEYKFYRDQRNLYLWSSLATIFISMFDAYVDAHLYDFDKEMQEIGLQIYPDTGKGLSLKLSFGF